MSDELYAGDCGRPSELAPAKPVPAEPKPVAFCASARARRAASDWSSYGLALGGDAFGAKLGALADEVLGRGVLVAGLAGAAACGRKLGAPERPLVLGVELGGLLAGRVLGFAGAELLEAEFGDEGGVSPGVLVRAAPPPLAAALAAAASAGLEAPRTGAGALFAGGGVATV
ncbi:MAG TPA: hypothetical protein VLL08_08725 [Kineosporiaceae bacterium]|nr:hypothetical protein [Kineosporiaceae bacterium]